ncbi:hypothetical protein TNCV_133561 [Trichonephila clavipes]|nr:hypothetical protein TNCV_133561 [Trichonephila clavipes]
MEHQDFNKRYQLPQVILTRWHLRSDDAKLNFAESQTGTSRDFLHAAQSYDTATADFLHHENPPTWAGVEPTTLGAEGQRQTNYATQSATHFVVEGSSTRGEFTSYKPAFLQAARKLAQCTHRTRLKAAFKKALEKVDSDGDFTRHSPAFERFRFLLWKEFASDPKCVVNNSSEIQLASFGNFVVIHSIFPGVVAENQRIASLF